MGLAPSAGGVRVLGDRGQATVEYALVLLAFLAMLAALAALWHASRGGALLSRAMRAASHVVEEGAELAAVQDVLSY